MPPWALPATRQVPLAGRDLNRRDGLGDSVLLQATRSHGGRWAIFDARMTLAEILLPKLHDSSTVRGESKVLRVRHDDGHHFR